MRPTQVLDVVHAVLRLTRRFDYRTRTATLGTAALVCRSWAVAAVALLWEDRRVSTTSKADDFRRFTESTRLAAPGGGTYGRLVRRLKVVVIPDPQDLQTHIDIDVVFGAASCPNLRAINDFPVLFRACPRLVVLDLSVVSGRLGRITYPDSDEERAFWEGEGGDEVRRGVARLRSLQVDPRLLMASPFAFQRQDPESDRQLHLAAGANLREWRGMTLRSAQGFNLLDILDQLPNLEHIIKYDPPTGETTFPTGKQYPALKSFSANSITDKTVHGGADVFAVSLLSACPNLQNLEITHSGVTSLLLTSLEAHRNLELLHVNFIRGLTQPTLIDYLKTRGGELRSLTVPSPIAATGSLLCILPTACPHLRHVQFEVEPRFSSLELRAWLTVAVGLVSVALPLKGLRAVVEAAGVSSPKPSAVRIRGLRELIEYVE
ncbi:hypothetical protein BDK51DRAFT_39267 [Blyttiomyces helicus]|uniref:F-box domain-containing protein n=1 Tax=Blyttiomyces helicus TaxID=388810 RepID=A0A4P9W565_9FUNG|nr:hypothetical protein BDK51DRAFT_39267 [Blyttiomyces helicus]|eukprot:RKO87374.1 hypothetical protein BDK51DRAFT_39267 [Blyttiomyces helicus]